MAHHKAAKKHIRQTKKRTARNRSFMSSVRTQVKSVSAAVGDNNTQKAIDSLKKAQSLLAKSVKKNLMHKNTASRRVAKLASQIKAMS